MESYFIQKRPPFSSFVPRSGNVALMKIRFNQAPGVERDLWKVWIGWDSI
jgi:hypothetical protein